MIGALSRPTPGSELRPHDSSPGAVDIANSPSARNRICSLYGPPPVQTMPVSWPTARPPSGGGTVPRVEKGDEKGRAGSAVSALARGMLDSR